MSTQSAIIVTHQSRIRCLMHMYGIGILGSASVAMGDDDLNERLLGDESNVGSPSIAGGGGAKIGHVASFKNGCVLRVRITRDEVNVSLVVSGEIGAGEDKPGYTYFTSERSMPNSPSVSYTEIPFPNTTIRNTFYGADVVRDDDVYELYLIRHGQATHNVLKGFGKMMSNKDTDLTPLGREQAGRSGDALFQAIVANGSSLPTHLFASDLRRTRQTLVEVMHAYPASHQNLVQPMITILPCAHELRYAVNKDTGKCDGSKIPSAAENTMACTEGSCGMTDKYKNRWDEYYKFYGNATRSSWIKTCKTCGTRHCRDTDMIKEAIGSIQTSEDATMRDAFDMGDERPDLSGYTDMDMGDDRDSVSSVAETVVNGGRRRRMTRRVRKGRRVRTSRKSRRVRKSRKSRRVRTSRKGRRVRKSRKR